MKSLLPLIVLLLARTLLFAESIGPEKGALVIVGGGRLTREIAQEFIRLASGIDAPFVIIPTADVGDEWDASYLAKSFLARSGAKALTVLHTRDRALADSEAFVAPLTLARGVWFDGGRQWRLAEAYLNTRTERELHAVLARGGVIGGSSAGATIQGSYLVRGAPEGNQIMMAKGHEKGFGFLKESAIDQHVNTRRRDGDLAPVIEAHPQLLGLGLDEATAVIVQGDRLRVMGEGRALFHAAAFTPNAEGRRYFPLTAGDELDLKTRRKITP